MADTAEWSRVAYIALAAAGFIAAAVLSFPGAQESAVAGGCTEEATEVAQLVPGAAHPAKNFYAPNEKAPEEDLDHVVGDGLFILRYRPDLPAGSVRAIETLVTTGSEAVIAAPDPEQTEAVRAIQAEQTLSCERFDGRGLTEFRDGWLARVQR